MKVIFVEDFGREECPIRLKLPMPPRKGDIISYSTISGIFEVVDVLWEYSASDPKVIVKVRELTAKERRKRGLGL